MNEYALRVAEDLRRRYAHEPEYLQAVLAWLELIDPALGENPEYERLDLLARMVEPDRIVTFLVPWVDDQGRTHTNHGYRVQFSNALGPYKGGLRFQPGVNLSVVKFLGFEQTYKNALIGLPVGGAAGGADFDPRGRSRREVMRFCQSFMTGLYRYVGADTDVPAGDIGVGDREIGYLYGAYKRLTGRAERGALTGKGVTYGGSKVRQEAAGYGAVYFLCRMLERQGETLEGKRLVISGFGNTAWGVCRKAAQLGGKVVTLSGPDGYVYDPDGVCAQEKFDFMAEMRAGGEDRVEPYAFRFGLEFFPGRKPWEVPGGHRDALRHPERDRRGGRGPHPGQPGGVLRGGGQYARHAGRPAAAAAEPGHPGGRGQGLRRGGRGGLRPGDGPELPALQLAEEAGGGAAAADHGGHPRRLRRGGGGLRAGLRPDRRQRHRLLPEGLPGHDGPGAMIG